MPILNRITYIGRDSVAHLPIVPGQKYQITPWKKKRNVRMGMVATGDQFPDGKAYYYHQPFDYSEHQPPSFTWTAGVPGHPNMGYTDMFFYLLLPWKASIIPGAPEPLKPTPTDGYYYEIGIGDGERNDLPGQEVAALIAAYLGQPGRNDRLHPPPADTITFPAEVVALDAPFGARLRINKKIDENNYRDYARFSIPDQAGKPGIELKARIHIIDGKDNTLTRGLITPQDQHTGYARISNPEKENPDPEAFLQLFALVAPTRDPDNPNAFDFDVGDPERNGKVTITQV